MEPMLAHTQLALGGGGGEKTRLFLHVTCTYITSFVLRHIIVYNVIFNM